MIFLSCLVVLKYLNKLIIVQKPLPPKEDTHLVVLSWLLCPREVWEGVSLGDVAAQNRVQV